MRVLHVSLGLPPLRTGGMTRYCVELAQSQREHGDRVALLFPGRFLPGKTRIKHSLWRGIETFEVINPLPVALTYGIDSPAQFTASCNAIDAYEELLSTFRPSYIHVHCFQGIHSEFFTLAKSRSIPLLFTTHDYYPMCSRCTFVNPLGERCMSGPAPERCAKCNSGRGMTFQKNIVMQSATYAWLKDSGLMRLLGERVKKGMNASRSDKESNAEPSHAYVKAFEKVIEYNSSIVESFDVLLSNSELTERIYRQYYPRLNYVKLPITHSGLNRRVGSEKDSEGKRPTRIAYYGGNKKYKGIEVLAEASKLVFQRGVQAEFLLYGDDYPESLQIVGGVKKGRLDPRDVQTTMRRCDFVVVPSTYPETFGFVVLEALCCGTPVICSDAVGASDLLSEECIFMAGDSVSLANAIENGVKGNRLPANVPENYPLSMDEQRETIEAIVHGL